MRALKSKFCPDFQLVQATESLLSLHLRMSSIRPSMITSSQENLEKMSKQLLICFITHISLQISLLRECLIISLKGRGTLSLRFGSLYIQSFEMKSKRTDTTNLAKYGKKNTDTTNVVTIQGYKVKSKGDDRQ